MLGANDIRDITEDQEFKAYLKDKANFEGSFHDR